MKDAAGGANLEFRGRAAMRFAIEHDVEGHIDASSSGQSPNQLNFTKRRTPERARAGGGGNQVWRGV